MKTTLIYLLAAAGWLSALAGLAQSTVATPANKLSTDRPSVRRYPDNMPKTVTFHHAGKTKEAKVRMLFPQTLKEKKGPEPAGKHKGGKRKRR